MTVQKIALVGLTIWLAFTPIAGAARKFRGRGRHGDSSSAEDIECQNFLENFGYQKPDCEASGNPIHDMGLFEWLFAIAVFIIWMGSIVILIVGPPIYFFICVSCIIHVLFNADGHEKYLRPAYQSFLLTIGLSLTSYFLLFSGNNFYFALPTQLLR